MSRFVLLLVLASCGNVVVSFPGDGGASSGSRACSTTNTCAAPLVCDGSGECVECVSDAQCSGATPACDTVTHRCVTCRGGVGCSGPEVCSASAPVCVRPCQDSIDCPGFTDGCRSNICSACNDAEDCGAGRFCDAPRGRCVSCLTDEHCSGATPRCELHTGTCRGCLTNADCSASSVCFQAACRPAR